MRVAHCPEQSVCVLLQGCRGPVHAQFVENWVAYHYFDVSNHRWEMSVLELYNKAQGNVTITDMVLGKTSNTMSSYKPAPLEVVTCSCALPNSAACYLSITTLHANFVPDIAHTYASGYSTNKQVTLFTDAFKRNWHSADFQQHARR